MCLLMSACVCLCQLVRFLSRFLFACFAPCPVCRGMRLASCPLVIGFVHLPSFCLPSCLFTSACACLCPLVAGGKSGSSVPNFSISAPAARAARSHWAGVLNKAQVACVVHGQHMSSGHKIHTHITPTPSGPCQVPTEIRLSHFGAKRLLIWSRMTKIS